MAKALVVMLCDEHDLYALFALAPGNCVYAECVLRSDELLASPNRLATDVCLPMIRRLQREQEWPRA